MLFTLSVLLLFQLAGEIVARGLSLPIPGPVFGLVFLALACTLRPSLRRALEPTSGKLLDHLSLLFLPAAVGVIRFLPLLDRDGLTLAAAVIGSTLLAMTVTALVFAAASRRLTVNGGEQ
jgi:holin-like protein